jgi:hypothetical protein
LPQLYIVPINQTLGVLCGILFFFEGQVDAFDNVSFLIDDVGVEAIHFPPPQSILGGFKPGDRSQSLMWLAVSSCLIFFTNASLSGPFGAAASCSVQRAFSAAI